MHDNATACSGLGLPAMLESSLAFGRLISSTEPGNAFSCSALAALCGGLAVVSFGLWINDCSRLWEQSCSEECGSWLPSWAALGMPRALHTLVLFLEGIL